jgi:hypothetical protein
MMEGMNPSTMYCKNFCECDKIPPVQQFEKENSIKFGQWGELAISLRYIIQNKKMILKSVRQK